MTPGSPFKASAVIAVTLALHCVAARAAESSSVDSRPRSPACWETQQGMSLRMDNDLFAGSPHDSDYTGGVAIDWTPENQSRYALPHRLHWNVDRFLGMDADRCRRHAWQVGLFSLTPGTLRSKTPVLNDRPFATVLVFGTTATWNGDSERVALQSTLQVGMLGLDLAEDMQRAVHKWLGNERPRGYEFQVSRGGEPTFRYELARHQLLRDAVVNGETLQLKRTVAMSMGYLTEASIGFSSRWGRIDSPWQSFTPELVGYLPTPMPLPLGARFGGRELFGFAGARLRLRVYNSLTQGQFRDSVHVLEASQLERWIGEAWLGVHWEPAQNWELTYTIRAQTPELRDNPARRSMVWAGLAMSRRF